MNGGLACGCRSPEQGLVEAGIITQAPCSGHPATLPDQGKNPRAAKDMNALAQAGFTAPPWPSREPLSILRTLPQWQFRTVAEACRTRVRESRLPLSRAAPRTVCAAGRFTQSN